MTKLTLSPRPQRLALAVHAAMLALPMTAICAAPSGAHAQATAQAPAQAMHDFDIPAGPLSTALTRAAAQSGVPLTADAALTAGKTAPALKGRMTLREALAQLLAGSGLAAGTEGASIVIKAAPPAPGGAKEAVLPVVTVRAGAEQESAWGPVRGYVAKRSATATKTDTPTIEVPQSISVIGRDEMDDRGVNSVTEAMRYVPGVMSSVYGQDDRGYEWFSIRGFSNAYNANYLDGLRQTSPIFGYAVPQNEPYGLERVEVLRGPTSALYGQGDAGGIIHRISKRPRADATQEIEVQLGNFGRKQVALDLGGAADADGKAAWRLVALGLDTEPQIDYPGYDERRNKRTYVAPSLSWKPSTDTSLTLLADYLDIRAGTNATEYMGADLRRTGVLIYEPSYDFSDQRQWNLGYQFEHRPNVSWTVRQNLRTSRTDIDSGAVLGFNGTADAAGVVPRNTSRTIESLRYTVFDNQLQGRVNSGGVEHMLLFGIDWLDTTSHQIGYWDAGPSLNIFNPVYGQPVIEPQALSGDREVKMHQFGLYAQDQMKLDAHWRLLASLRHDRVRTDTDDRLAGSLSRSKDSATTGQLGVTYVMDSGLAPYVSYSESFFPQGGSDFNGTLFQPTRGKQYEAGVKYQPASGKGLMTLALFDLTKTNILTADKAHFGYSVQTGEARSRGLEFEVKQDLTAGLKLSAQYTYLDTKVTKSNDTDLGKRLPNVPKHMASAWLNYKVQGGDWRGLGFGLGARYTGNYYDDTANTARVPSRTLMDAALNYETGPWNFALNVNNLFDKHYAASYVYGYYRGSRRTAILSAKYRF